MSEAVFQGYVCPKCKWSDFVQASRCPKCKSETQTISFTGKGKLATFTVIRYPPEGFEKDAPYAVGIVDLDEGVRVIGKIGAKLDGLRIGQRVKYSGISNGALNFTEA